MMQANKMAIAVNSTALFLLIELFTKRVAIWPVPEYCEDEEALKRYHAQKIVERYEELLGMEKIVKIVNSASTEQAIEELILHELN
jgi:hypothetical protein